MKRRDSIVEIECTICERIFSIQVNEEDYKNFSESDLQKIEMEQLFPYLNDEETNLMITGICDHCG